jgi:hypothetical protein
LEVRILAGSISALPPEIVFELLLGPSGHYTISGPAAYKAIWEEMEEAIAALPVYGTPKGTSRGFTHGRPSNYYRCKRQNGRACDLCSKAAYLYNRKRARKKTG